MIADQGRLRISLVPLLAAFLLVVTSCGSSSGGDDGSSVEDSTDNTSDEIVAEAESETGTICGPMRFEESEISQASGRVNDSAKEAFNNAGRPLLAEEQWSVVRETELQVAVADPDPLSEGGSSYWVRIVDGGVLAFDGVCDFAEPVSSTAPVGPASCSVTADGFAITTIWDGADPSLPVAVLRDGIEIHLFAATAMSPEANELLDARRAEHGEPVLTEGGQGAVATEGQGGFADLAAEPNATHDYAVQAIGLDGSRSETLACGQATLDAGSVDVSCSVATDEFGWPVIRWQAGTPVRVVIVRDGSAIEPDAVTFSSPHTDRTAPAGQEISYQLEIPGGETVACGAITMDTTPTGSSDLQAIATDNSTSNQGPYQYVTLEPVCSTCEGQIVELYLVPNPDSPTEHIVETVWVDGAEQSFPGPWLVDPLTVANLLLEAEADQLPTAYSVDAATGIIDQWTIDGEGAVLQCLEVDTRPIDMREKRCGESNLLR